MKFLLSVIPFQRMAIYVSNSELHETLRTSENDSLDFKSATLLLKPNGKNRHSIAKHMVGFANHKGGKLVFGVNDAQEPEGDFIEEEKALGTISSIVSSNISPVIDFTYTYYSSEQDDLSEGSVFVLEIPESSAPVPHAIIEEADGKIRKREYRIRAGESTRLVSNEELLALFDKNTERTIRSEKTIHHMLERDYTPAVLTYKPRYQSTFERLFEELGDDTENLIEKIRDGNPLSSDQGMGNLVDSQYAMVVTSLLLSPTFMDVWDQELIKRMDNQITSLSFELKSLEPSDVSLRNDSNPLLDNTDMDVPGFLPSYGEKYDNFKIPLGSEVIIWEEFDGFSITNEDFTLDFSIELLEVGVGLPKRHPESPVEFGTYGNLTRDKSKCTMYSHVEVECDINYPTHGYSKYQSYRAYCEAMIERFDETYDWDDYIDQLPSDKLFAIEETVEEIHSKLHDLDNPDG